MVNLRANIFVFIDTLLKPRNISIVHTVPKVRLSTCHATSDRNSNIHVGSTGATIGALFEKWHRKFKLESISEPQESIQHILAYVLGTINISDVYRLKNKTVNEDDIEQIEFLCSRRLQNMPIQYVLGEWYFRNLNLKMSPPVFIPRPETEQLIDIVSTEITRKKCKQHIADLCCGSGAIALSLLQEQNSIIATAVDQSKEACQLTKENAQKNGLNRRIRVIQSQLDQWNWDNEFDIVVANPPYVFEEDLEKLQPEIKLYEDLEALNGGVDGLNVIKIILKISSQCLIKTGKLFLEVEPRHPPLLQNYLQKNALGFSFLKTYRDFYGKDRFVEIIKTL